MKKIVFIPILVLVLSFVVSLNASYPKSLDVITDIKANSPPIEVYKLDFEGSGIEAGTMFESTRDGSRWDITDPNVKWVQNPDPSGWDVYATYPMVLADDFLCIKPEFIKDIHFWGSWFGNNVGEIISFEFNIYGDIPVGPNNGYSMPNASQWSYTTNAFTMVEQTESSQGWYYPPGDYEDDNHDRWFEYSVDLPSDNWFWQQGTENEPIIYWLSISANLVGPNELWGWKSSINHWNDDAVYRIDAAGAAFPWGKLYEPSGASMDLAFVLTGNDIPLPVELSSFTGAFNSDLCSSTLSWTTQSESENMGWNVYRSSSTDFNESIQLNASIISGAGNTSEPTNYQYQDLSDMQFNTEYRYWLECLSFDSNSQQFGPIVVSTLSEEEDPDAPDLVIPIGLQQNYPNPFNPDTQISFIMAEAGECDLTIYDTKGRIVNNLFQGNVEAEQNYTFTWDGKDNQGKNVVSGIYLYKIKSGRYIETKKMILMK